MSMLVTRLKSTRSWRLRWMARVICSVCFTTWASITGGNSTVDDRTAACSSCWLGSTSSSTQAGGDSSKDEAYSTARFSNSVRCPLA